MRGLGLLILCSLTVHSADPAASGVPVGKRPGPYSFLVATGAERGQQTCYICEQADKPTALVFTRLLTKPVGELLVQLDQESVARKGTGFKAWMTLLTNKADLDHLAKWSQENGLKNLPVGAFEDEDGPPSYKISKDVDVTVLLFVKEKVVANYSLKMDELTKPKMQEIRKSISKLFR